MRRFLLVVAAVAGIALAIPSSSQAQYIAPRPAYSGGLGYVSPGYGWGYDRYHYDGYRGRHRGHYDYRPGHFHGYRYVPPHVDYHYRGRSYHVDPYSGQISPYPHRHRHGHWYR